jgi:hypothetical protein
MYHVISINEPRQEIIISSSTSHQTYECIMSSPSMNQGKTSSCETHQATISINASHLHQVIKARSSCDQGKVISKCIIIKQGIIKARSKLHHHQPNSISIIWAPPHQTMTTARETIKNATHKCCCHQYNHQAGWHQ